MSFNGVIRQKGIKTQVTLSRSQINKLQPTLNMAVSGCSNKDCEYHYPKEVEIIIKAFIFSFRGTRFIRREQKPRKLMAYTQSSKYFLFPNLKDRSRAGIGSPLL